jgi:hypothetical protein
VTDYAALLRELAVPRRTGTPGHAAVRAALKRELAARGFVVLEHHFAARALVHRLGRVPLAGVNLIAVRPGGRVTVWLVAHYDAKGQPLSMAGRLVAAGLGALGALALVGAAGRALAGAAPGAAAALAGAAVLVGAALLAGTRVTDGSPGAVDNATGVVTVLAVADRLPAGATVGVIFSDAEEYGLVGARALARERPELLRETAVLNFDGIDDGGRTRAVMHRSGPLAAAVAAAAGARPARWLPILVDGRVLARAAAESVTLVRGGWRTARVVHTPRDTAARLALTGVRAVAAGVAAALAARAAGAAERAGRRVDGAGPPA